ncbi:MAG: DUF4215 domain-containing protein, partial [DPANN group archaeon]|nr:DUF4215 domain-containing protein [DPANN group archaeon]
MATVKNNYLIFIAVIVGAVLLLSVFSSYATGNVTKKYCKMNYVDNSCEDAKGTYSNYCSGAKELKSYSCGGANYDKCVLGTKTCVAGPDPVCRVGKCTTNLCGDGIVYGKEQCDDGNTQSGDGCSRRCTIEACVPSWSCTAWSVCSTAGTQTRTCTDANNCGTTTNKPAESQACTPPPTCTDTDGGNNVNQQGTCTGSNGTAFADSCNLGWPDGQQYIIEQYCAENGQCKSSGYPLFDCASVGKVCQNGACVAPSPTCTDTDGGKSINFGTCTGTNGTLTDGCTFWVGNNQQYIVEQYCLADGQC